MVLLTDLEYDSSEHDVRSLLSALSYIDNN